MPPGASPHCVFHSGRDYKCRLRLRRGDARGEAPCIRKLKISPFPGGEGGRGDGGKKKAKGGGGRRQRRQAPRRVPDWQVEPAPRGFSPGDARGEAPCIRKLKNLPLPRSGRGRGDGGRKANQRQGRQATRKASPPSGTTFAGIASAARVQPPPAGCRDGRDYKHRRRFNAGVPGAEPPAK